MSKVKKQSAWVIVVIVAIVIIALAYYLWSRSKSTPSSTTITSGTNSTTTTNTETTSSDYPLKLGSRGTLVKNLQTKLNSYYTEKTFFDVEEISEEYPRPAKSLTIDGVWGKDTEAMFRYIALGQGEYTKTMATTNV